MDTLGAAIGPVLALVWLQQNPGHYRELFLFALFPGIVAVILSFLLREKVQQPATMHLRWWDFWRYYTKAPSAYRRTVNGLLLFTLFNSSDVFLLLILKWRGFSDEQLIGFYIFYNLIYALFSYPMGKIGDQIGIKKTFLGGLVTFIVVYAAIAHVQNFYGILALFFAYGCCRSSTLSGGSRRSVDCRSFMSSPKESSIISARGRIARSNPRHSTEFCFNIR